MKNILLIALFFLSLSNCITYEKTKCHKEKKEKVSGLLATFDDCKITLIAITTTNAIFGNDQRLIDIALLSCLVQHSVYLECKDESPIAPVVY